jgi:hypothetical protein
LTLIDTIQSLRGTISKIYLMDAAAEISLVRAWILLLLTIVLCSQIDFTRADDFHPESLMWVYL